MATRKPQPAPSLFKPAPLPIRIYRLHGKLAVAVAIGVVVAVAMHTLEMRGVARALIGWDAGVIVYLALTYAMMWRTDVEAMTFSNTWATFSRMTSASAPLSRSWCSSSRAV